CIQSLWRWIINYTIHRRCLYFRTCRRIANALILQTAQAQRSRINQNLGLHLCIVVISTCSVESSYQRVGSYVLYLIRCERVLMLGITETEVLVSGAFEYVYICPI